jgi:type II secretory pathway pseudopilin PulG
MIRMFVSKRNRGISILEIMMAMSLMTVVIVAFATVFPSGYRLNFSNLNQNKAAGLANSVVEELRGLDMATLEAIASGSMKPAAMKAAKYFSTPVGIGTPLPGELFYIPNDGTGIEVTMKNRKVTLAHESIPGKVGQETVRTARVQVTVQWTESRRSGTIPKKVSVVSMATSTLRKSFSR